MNKPIDRTPTLEECLTLWKQKGELTSEIESLKTEQSWLARICRLSATRRAYTASQNRHALL